MAYNRDLFDGLIVFCAVVESGGFSAAARALGHTPPHVSKEVAKLEDRLQTRLLNRTTRSVSLTEAGEGFYRDVRQIVDEAGDAEKKLASLSASPSGLLKISVPVALARSGLDTWLAEFLDKYRDIRIDLETSERMVDIVAEGFDVVVRAGYLGDSDLIARRLAESRRIVVAAPDYLAQAGTPGSPEELKDHAIIDFSGRRTVGQWPFIGPDGKRFLVSLTPRVICNSAETEQVFAIEGVGVTALPEFVCRQAIHAGQLMPILEEFEEPPIGLYAIYPSRSQLAAKIRVFVDFLAEKLGSVSFR